MGMGFDPLADTYAKPISDYAASLGEYLDAVADEAWANNPLPSYLRLVERRRAERGDPLSMGMPEMGIPPTYEGPRSRMIPKREANERAKDLGLTFDRDTPEEVVELLIARRRERLAAETVYRRARLEGYGVGRAALSVLTEFAVSAADPINIASAFVPVVGPARMAAWSARLGRGGAALARGSIEGAVGAALVEPIVAANALEEDPDYGLGMSVANIAFGTALGGGLHWLGSRLRPARRSDPGPAPDAPARDAPPADPGAPPRLPPGPDEPDVPQRTAEAVEEMPRGQREAMQRVGAAQLLQDRRIDVADLAPGVERRLLGQAYDAVRAAPAGRFDAPLVVLKPGDIEDVVVSRGGWKGIGDVTVKGQGFGLAKIIWRHGDESAKPPALRVAREDVLALPDILRLYEPSRSRVNPDGSVAWREWRVEREWQGQTRTVVYAANRFDDPGAVGAPKSGEAAVTRLVTIFVDENPGAVPLSQRKGAPSGSSGPVLSGAGDTAAEPFNPLARSRDGAPEETVAQSLDRDKLEAWAERQQAPESDLHADFAAAERVEAAAAEAKAAHTPEQDLADLEAVWGKALGDEERAALAGDVAAVRDPQLVEAARVVKALDDEAKAIDALAVCQAGGKPDGV